MKQFILKYWDKIALLFMLLVMFVAMFFSSIGDSPIVDEIAHIPSGFSYLTTGDYRLNPEHPPLIKDLAAIPLVIVGEKFPYDLFLANEGGVNNQWEMGWEFIYRIGNDPDTLVLLARLPIMLLSLLLGYLVFRWASQLYGRKAGVFALVLYVFDANIIAHSRFVTTDLGISFALFFNLFALYNFIKKPNYKSLILVGLTFGIALITKFSAGILAPVYLIVFIMALIKKGDSGPGFLSHIGDKFSWRKARSLFLSFALISIIGILVAWIFYFPHTMNLSAQNQKDLITQSLPDSPGNEILKSMSDSSITRPLAQYVLGFTMVSGHVEGGHNAYLLGMTSNKGWWYYYPVVIALKVALPVLIFMAIMIFFRRKFHNKDWFTQMYLLIVPFTLLFVGMIGHIDIGIRYMLPIFPFIFVYLSPLSKLFDYKNLLSARRDKWKAITTSIMSILMIWYIVGSLVTFPYYLSYFNETIGGYKNGYKYLTDSNLDWGQDIRRLNTWIKDSKLSKEHGCENKTYVDVFPGTFVAKYYIGSERMVEWHVQNGRPDGCLALSATFRYTQKDNPSNYDWLNNMETIDNIGGSILIYDLTKR